MKKVTGLFLCVVCVFTFSAYDWGRKPKAKKDTQGTQQTSDVTQTASIPATAPVVFQKKSEKTYKEVETTTPAMTKKVAQEKVSEKKETTPSVEKAMPPAASVAETPVSANDKAVAIVTLAKIVGSGTPEERKARIESLKRLSQALAKSQGQQT